MDKILPVSHLHETEGQDGQQLLQRGGVYVFLTSFVLATVIGIFIQLVFLPLMMPGLHAGHGLLLGGDWVGYHEDGVKLANLIASHGWKSFELRPDGNAPVAISAVVYYLTGIREPWVLVPLSAAVFALGAVGLFNIFSRIGDPRLAVVALLPYLLLPGSVQFYSEVEKDVWSIAGFIWLTFVWTILAEYRCLRLGQCFALIGISFSATALAWLVRPYLAGVFLGAFACGTVILAVWQALAKRKRIAERVRRWSCFGLCLVVIGIFAFDLPSKFYPSLAATNPSNLFGTARDAQARPDCGREPNAFDRAMPSRLKRALNSIINVRIGQRAGGLRAGSAIDHDVCFSQPTDVVFYIPRSLQVGFFAPFPNMWFTGGVSPGARMMRSIAGGEMLVSYVLLAGIPVLLVLTGIRQREQVFLGLIITSLIICLLATAIPNVGTLYRMRYGYLQIFLGFGIIGWGCAWRVVRDRSYVSYKLPS